jgi:hypothetical protein
LEVDDGCGFHADMHTKDGIHARETQQRLSLVAAWREAKVFTDAERPALELGEQGTWTADAACGATDAWANAARRFDEDQLIVLVSHIAVVNVCNLVRCPLSFSWSFPACGRKTDCRRPAGATAADNTFSMHGLGTAVFPEVGSALPWREMPAHGECSDHFERARQPRGSAEPCSPSVLSSSPAGSKPSPALLLAGARARRQGSRPPRGSADICQAGVLGATMTAFGGRSGCAQCVWKVPGRSVRW